MNPSNNFDIKVAEQVLDQAIMNNKPHYLIKWKYLPHQFDTWQSIENLQPITHLIQSWIIHKRPHLQLQTLSHVSSYFDTVNYINPLKKSQRKRKPISKPKKPKHKNKQIVILDQQNQTTPNMYVKNNSDDSFIDDSEQIQPYQRREFIQQESPLKESNWNVQESQTAQDQCKVESTLSEKRVFQPLKYDPEEQYFQEKAAIPLPHPLPLLLHPQQQIKKAEAQQLPQNKEQINTPSIKKGMKVVGHIRSQQILTIGVVVYEDRNKGWQGNKYERIGYEEVMPTDVDVVL